MTNKKQVSNTKEKVPSGIEMNDMDYLNVVLTIEKNMSNNYSIALNEASNDYLFEDYFNLFEDTKDMGRDIYNLMFEKGWYQLEKAEDKKINEKISSFTKQLSDLESN